MLPISPTTVRASTCAVWSVRPRKPYQFDVSYQCRGGMGGRFTILVAPWLIQEFDLPWRSAESLATHAAALLIDTHAGAGLEIPGRVDLEAMAVADPAFIPGLRSQLDAGAASTRSLGNTG